MSLRGIFKRKDKKPKTKKERSIVKQYADKYKAETLDDMSLTKNAEISCLAKTHQDSMLNHSDRYTILLGNYVHNSYYTLRQKRRFKECFFWVTITSLALAFALFFTITIIILVNNTSSEVNITEMSALLSSFISLLSLYIIIPKIIAQYLFNIKEDENMTDVIKSIQQYDTTVATQTRDESDKPEGGATDAA